MASELAPSQVTIGDAPAIWMLACGQTFGFASLFYIYGALLVSVESDTGWGRAALAIGLTLAALVSAAAVPFAGRLIDRGLGAEMLTAGAAVGGIALLGLSQVTSLAGWYFAWACIGLAMASSLYDMCFAFLNRRLGPGARAAIIRITLVAGFASTIAFPLGAVLADMFGWRGAVIVFAFIQLGLTVPLNYYAGRRLRRKERVEGPSTVKTPHGSPLRRAMRLPAFWLVAGAFGLATMNHSMLVTYFIPLFTGLGAGKAMAVVAASLVGPFQVLGRIFLMMQGGRVSTLLSTKAALFGLAAASLVLLSAGLSPQLIFVFAMVQGTSIGMVSILRPVLIVETLGSDGVGAISGAIATVPLVAGAIAPIVGAVLLESAGIPALLIASLSMALVGAGFALAIRISMPT